MTDRGAELSRRDLLRLGLVGRTRVARGGVRLGRRTGSGAEAPRLQPDQRLGGREDLSLAAPAWRRSIRSSARTPERHFPAYSITWNRTRVYPRCLPRTGRWRWAGWCGRPCGSPWRCWRRCPAVTYTVKHHCVEGWTAIGTWTGVPVSVDRRAWCEPAAGGAVSSLRLVRQRLLQRLGPRRARCTRRPSWPTPSTTARSTASAARRSGSTRPIKLGYKLTKYVTAMTFTRERPRRVLGGPGLSLVRGSLASSFRSD